MATRESGLIRPRRLRSGTCMENPPLTPDANGTTRMTTGDAFLDPFSRPRLAIVLVIAAFALTGLFYLVPGIDIAISGLFFRAQPCAEGVTNAVCGTFPLASDSTLNDVRDFFHQMPIVVAILLLIAAVSISIRGDTSLQRLATGIYVALAALIVNSLFIVNLWLKSYSGRPRPEQTDLFGGSLPFVPAGEFTDFCATNCAFGGHYFSDAVIAAVASVATFAVLASLARVMGLGKTVPASTAR